MTVKILIQLTGCQGDLQGLKEAIAMDFEKYGNVRVLSVTTDEPEAGEQMRMD